VVHREQLAETIAIADRERQFLGLVFLTILDKQILVHRYCLKAPLRRLCLAGAACDEPK